MKYFIILLFSFSMLLSDTIKFSPLPIDKSTTISLQYKEMLQYLEKETGEKYELIYSSSYEELINNFKDGIIDIIELDSIPFITLKKEFKDAESFLTFKSQDGQAFYTCDVVTTNLNFKDLYDLEDRNQKIKLPYKLSTCGYLMTEFIFNQFDKTVKDFKYKYSVSHTDVLLELLLTQNSIGTVKSTILNKYKHLNFNVIAKSPQIPGFAFIANKQTIDNHKIQKIQKAILKLNPLTNLKDKELVSRWSINTKYGAVKTDQKSYQFVLETLEKLSLDTGYSR